MTLLLSALPPAEASPSMASRLLFLALPVAVAEAGLEQTDSHRPVVVGRRRLGRADTETVAWARVDREADGRCCSRAHQCGRAQTCGENRSCCYLANLHVASYR